MASFQRLRPPVRGGSPAPAAFRPRPFGEEAPPPHHPPGAAERHGFRFDAVKVPGAAPVQRAPLASALTAPSRAPVQRVKDPTKQQSQGTPFSQKTKDEIFKANQDDEGFYSCERCGFQHKQRTYFKVDDDTGGSTVPKVGKKKIRKRCRVGDGCFHVDHLDHKSKGGGGTLDNGRVLCGTCNTSRGDKNRIKKTGMMKFPGLHRGLRMHVMKKTAYKTGMAVFKKSKGRKPLIQKEN